MVINILKVILWGLLGIGLYGALSVSYTTITGTSPCPSVAGIPACFVVLAGYTTMLIATLTNQHNKARWLFLFGWTPVFLLAFVGTLFEIGNGNTCPKSTSGLALCYVSLTFAIAVALLYFLILKARKGVNE
jgi:hypothetical protein